MTSIHHMAGQVSAAKHVVFVHGLGGHYQGTWMGGAQRDAFWPEWLCDDVPGLCIWSIEYDSASVSGTDRGMQFQDLAENVFDAFLLREDILSKEIILIGHSLGGLIIKQMMRLASDRSARSEARDLLCRVTGVAFLGTPHAGSDISSLGNRLFLRLLMGVAGRRPTFVSAYLFRNSADLRNLNVWYRQWTFSNPVNHLILGEGKRTPWKGMIVKPDSSDPGLNATMTIIPVDHTGICKPVSRDDQIYRAVKNFVATARQPPQNLWLRSTFGNTTSHWQGYNNWSGERSGGENTFLIDEKIKLVERSHVSREKLSTVNTLCSLQKRLRTPGTSVRLIGLSGVGKTRLVQALFEPVPGCDPLPHDFVYYTDTSFSPEPTPAALLERLIATHQVALVIVDNCSQDMHRVLSEILRHGNRSVSLLTVEYDVREDLPEGTEVISMEPNSEALIEALILRKYAHISHVNASKIAAFSGGNARLAIALAASIGTHENISSLQDDVLFERLFYQRHEKSDEIKKAGEVLSLVYSFQYEESGQYSRELNSLGKVSGISVQKLYEFSKELCRRDLAQKRDVWMAILPPPVANRLASLALENIPVGRLLSIINPDKSRRLFLSFTRRLGYLSHSKEAIKCARNLLSINGFYEQLLLKYQNEPDKGYDLIFSCVANVAPVAPRETLNFIERLGNSDLGDIFLSRKNPAFILVTRLLRSLAYDGEYFSQSVHLLTCFTLTEDAGEKNNSVFDVLKSLFSARLSGTCATIEQRLKVVDAFLAEGHTEIALKLMSELLKTRDFMSSYGFDFGTGVRDYGYEPSTYDEVNNWYSSVLGFLEQALTQKPELLSEGIRVLSSHMRGLWKLDCIRDQLTALIRTHAFSDGGECLWDAACTALRFDKEDMGQEASDKLSQLTEEIKPDTVERRLNTFVLTNLQGFYGLEVRSPEGHTIIHGSDAAEGEAKALAQEIASDYPELLGNIIYSALHGDYNQSQVLAFATKIAVVHPDKKRLLDLMNAIIYSADKSKINLVVIQGVLQGIDETNKDLVDIVLDEYVSRKDMQNVFALLQLCIPVDVKSTTRILKHLQNPNIDVFSYRNLAYGQKHKYMSDGVLEGILKSLWPHKNGPFTCIEILNMRFYNERDGDYYPDESLLSFSRSLFIKLVNEGYLNTSDANLHSMAEVARRIFSCAEEKDVLLLLDAIFSPENKHIQFRGSIRELLKIVIEFHPEIILDGISSEKGVINTTPEAILSFRVFSHSLPLTGVPVVVARRWCKGDPELRFDILAGMICPFTHVDNNYVWTELAYMLIKESPSSGQVLEKFSALFTPTSWVGSYASTLSERTVLLEQLMTESRADIVAAATQELASLREKIETAREKEREEFRLREERFE
ncbi:hypothetical protein C3454_06780 [Citrobacter europaeus]|uniref:esterase/lipase family protein n=1 Tax=Citrobacter europaeus TaxID=1914243 RepID=UPI000F4E57B6|nr:hypothetical protein [Citrobacter europaeus]ROW36853.1 hypothetical protein C3454_06780 [Citrobacter europaeus]